MIPGHFFLGEVAYYLGVAGGGGVDVDVVFEGFDVEEDGFGVEE